MQILIKRGVAANVAALILARGELAFTTDTQDLYVGKDGTTAKDKLTTNNVYTPVEYQKYFERFVYDDDFTVYDHAHGDYVPLDNGGFVRSNYYPTAMQDEVLFVPTRPGTGVNDKLYVVTSGAEANTTWVYRSDTWVRLKSWASTVFDGGTF